jgi:hypothetical protein
VTGGRTFARQPAADGPAAPGRQPDARPGPAGNPIQHLQRTAGNWAVQRLLQDARHRDQPVEAAPPAVRAVLRAPGQPLDPAARAAMAPRLGQGLGLDQVRIHTGERAARAAQAVAARAFTVGSHVVFASGAYDPRGPAGQALLAHELAHVAEQRSTGRRAIARQPVEQYEEHAAAVFTREHFERVAKAGYWWPLITDTYDVEPLPRRLSNPEEFDAVLSVLWRVRPKGNVQRETKETVTIPPRGGAAGSKALLYEFTFRPRNPTDPNAKDSVRIEFLAEGATTTPVPAPAPSGSYRVPGDRSFSPHGFPVDALEYWEAHPEEERQLWHWIERLAPASFDQIVTTREVVKRKQVATTREISYRVAGHKDKVGKVQSVRVEFLGAFRPAVEPVPADYRDKDFADLEIEKLQARPSDKLGKVTIPANVPAGERLPVKYAIRTYFMKGTRNAEVDLVLPIPGKTNPVLYSLRFRASNDVDVERVGERGPDIAAGQVDPDRLDIARSPEFAENAADPKSLRAWLKRRYPLLKPAGTTTEELRENANKEVGAKAGEPDWFKNYAITILDADKGRRRLQTAHKLTRDRAEGMKDYEARELRFLEGVLETATRAILAKLRGLRMARQRVYIKAENEPQEERAGSTFTNGGDRTVVLYDPAFQGRGALFLGGKEGVLPEEAETIVHELGHVVGGSAIKKQFDKFVKKEGIKPFTHYAADFPEREFFAEAFQLYQTDPEWMRVNLSKLFDWFEALARTGKPPK